MTQSANQQPDKDGIFLQAMGTFLLFGGVVFLNHLVGEWFPTLKLINTFSTLLVFSVWIVFVYFCIRFYRVSKQTETPLTKK